MSRKHYAIIGAMLLCGIIDPVFAQEAATTTEVTSLFDSFPKLLHLIVGCLSWAWVGFAALAGKLMTNDLVFGGAFHMDFYLNKISTITKNIANFILGFGFIFFVGRTLWSEQGGLKEIVQQVGGFLLAGILVNTSIFFIQTMVDISTIGVSAVGGMMELFVGNNTETNENMMRQASKKFKLVYTQEGTMEHTIFEDENVTNQDILDSILPKSESIGGSLVYLGSSILNIQQYTLLQNTSEKTINTMLQGKNLALGFLVQLTIVGGFTLSLFVLVIANIIRIGMIWIFIALGPFFFLIRGLKRGGVKLPQGIGLDDIENGSLAFGSFMKMIFLPVFTTMMMSLVLIFSTALVSTLNTGNKTIQDVTINGTNTSINDVVDITYTGNFLGNDVKDTFADIIVTIATLLLVRFVTKHSIPKNTPIISNISNKIFNIAEKAIGSAPLIPFPGSTSNKSIGSIFQTFGNSGKLNPINQLNAMTNKRDNKQNVIAQNQINKWLGTDGIMLNNTHIQKIQTDLKNDTSTHQKVNTFLDSIQKIIQATESDKVSIKGSELFNTAILSELAKTMGPSADRANNGQAFDQNKPQLFFTKKIIQKILKKLSERGIRPDPSSKNSADISDLDTLQKTLFVYNK